MSTIKTACADKNLEIDVTCNFFLKVKHISFSYGLTTRWHIDKVNAYTISSQVIVKSYHFCAIFLNRNTFSAKSLRHCLSEIQSSHKHDKVVQLMHLKNKTFLALKRTKIKPSGC